MSFIVPTRFHQPRRRPFFKSRIPLLRFSRAPLCRILRSLLGAILFASPVTVLAQFTYETTNNTITITGYFGTGRNVTIPGIINGLPVVGIGNNAFYEKGINSVTFPSSLTSIGGGAFFSCSLNAVTIPYGVTNIGDGAFSACAFLTNIIVDSLNQQYSSSDGVLYDKSFARLIQCPGGKPGTFTTPDTVSSIGDGAFYGGNALAEAVIGGGVTNLGGWLFFQSRIESVRFLPGVTAIPHDAFTYCTLLTNVSIPGTANTIGSYAFHSCAGLANLTIPASVTNIAFDAMAYCTGLKALLFTGNAPNSGLDMSGNDAVVIYYLPGTSGWSPSFMGRPTSLWNPLFQAVRAESGELRAQVIGTTNLPILVEASSSLTATAWQPFLNCMLTNGMLSLQDPFSTGHPNRFYRIRWPWP